MKTRDEIQAAIDAARGTQGFAAADDGAADKVLECCAGIAALHPDGVAAIPIATIIALALQLLPIIFGDGGITIEKLQAVLSLILSIFQ